MKHTTKKWTVIALGGSIVRPDGINVRFLRRFRDFLLPFLKTGFRFVIVIGGGTLSREYQQAAGKIIKITNEDLDWIGIHATRLNAHLLRTIFYREAHPVVLDDAEKKIAIGRRKLIFAAGTRPGWSTDYIAARLAKRFRAKTFIIAGKPAYVYDKDYAKYENVKPIFRFSWSRYQKISGRRWIPGMHLPVDPIAAAFAKKWKLYAVIVKGTDLKNLGRAIKGESFKGSVITP
jgi:uridylate kinase